MELEWRSVLDEATGKYYYWNTKTDEVTWDNPIEDDSKNIPSTSKKSPELSEDTVQGHMYRNKDGAKSIDPKQYYSQDQKTKRHLEHYFNYEEYEMQRNMESLNKKGSSKRDAHFRKQRDDLKRKKILKKYGTDKKE